MIGRRVALLALATFAFGCGHSEPFAGADIEARGPFATTPHVQLTFNPGADGSATWTDDGTGILYTYAELTRRDHDRCLGILPAGGGSRTLSLCDDRPGHADSSETITAAALSPSGQLLYLAGSSVRDASLPVNTALFLATRDAPLQRRALVTFPVQLGGGTAATWFGGVTWINATQFVAIAQEITLVPACACAARDTVFNNLGIVRGTIPEAGAATLELIPGTAGIVAFTLAEGNTQLLYAQGRTVTKMPAAGGAAAVITTLPSPPFNTEIRRIDDISCRGTTCVLLVYEFVTPPPPGAIKPIWRLERMTTAGGATTLVESTEGSPWLSAKVSPTGPDVVVRVGSFKTGDLYLFRNFLP